MQPHLAQKIVDLLLEVGLVLRQTEGTDRLGDDVEHAPARIEAGIRILEDHLHAPAERRHVGATAAVGHVVAVDLDAARRRRIETDHEARHRGFAAARFTHQGEGLALGDLDVDAVDRLHDLAWTALQLAHEPGRRHVEVALEPVDADEPRVAGLKHRPAPSPRARPLPWRHAASRRHGWYRSASAPAARPGNAGRGRSNAD
jgi:hypothetical protein